MKANAKKVKLRTGKKILEELERKQDLYDVLPIAVQLGGIIDKESQIVKPFVGIYFPAELLKKMKWEKDTRLTLSVEKDCLKIYSDNERDPFIYDTNELIYEPLEEDKSLW